VSRELTPDQERKVREIRAALGKSDNRLRDDLISIRTFERSALKYKTGRIYAEWPVRIAGIRTELLRARARLDGLNTGLRAERRLQAGLTELAAAVDAWHRGLTSDRLDVIDAALASMKRHFAKAHQLGKAGLADLEQGR
jgi:hypothetical protein